jgi:hypothetical protein
MIQMTGPGSLLLWRGFMAFQPAQLLQQTVGRETQVVLQLEISIGSGHAASRTLSKQTRSTPSSLGHSTYIESMKGR